ncbi:hypothetical protein M758_5G190200 [Ceratodon purpureus]|nr:hypothetical protein M758_5G190200 [Ceratodon purpureus]
MEDRGFAAQGVLDNARDKAALVGVRGLEARRERLEKMEMNFCTATFNVQRELQGMTEVFKGLEEERASWRREREVMEGELCKLRAEVEQLRAALAASAPPQVCDVDRGSEEIDLKALAEHRWLESRQVLAPITPEAVRARTPAAKQAASGKENVRSNGEEVQRLRVENERLREKTVKLSKDYRSMRSQYNSLLLKDRPASKGDVGQLTFNQDELQAAVDSLDKPPKVRRRSSVEAQLGERCISSPSSSSDTNAPSTPLPPQILAETVTGPTAPTPGSKVKAEPVHLDPLPQFPSTRENTSRGSDAGLEREPDRPTENPVSSAMAGSRKRSLESLGKQPVKAPAFKFVEPVRKKAERENLQATECKLCKKFYDAVIEGDAKGMAAARCTHMDKSRHRFRNLPPSTPEGFWNIGFDSDF